MYDLLLIRGDDYDNIGDYLDAFQQLTRVAERDGLIQLFSTPELRDNCIESYEKRKDIFGDLYGSLRMWQICDKNGAYADAADEADRLAAMEQGKAALHEKVKAMDRTMDVSWSNQ